jgi:release factor glutamine methyltransferase
MPRGIIRGSRVSNFSVNSKDDAWTVGAARSWALAELRRSGVECPDLTADLLVAHILGWDRVRVLTHPEIPLAEDARVHLVSMISRRVAGEPLQYLTGEQEFYRLAMRVSPSVLIPRPETEILVKKALELAAEPALSACRFVDVGTGSGCIAVAIAHGLSRARVWAVDCSAPALRVARQNALRHRTAERVCLVRGDLLECFPVRPCFEFVLSNPPYVALAESDNLPPEVRDHEPHEALFAGYSGLDVCCRLIPEAAPRLVSGGYLLIEVGAGQADAVASIARRQGLTVAEILRDLQGILRCLVLRKN